MEIISETSKGETEDPKEEKTKSEKTKDEKAKKEKTKDKKASSKSSKPKPEKGEEKDIYFIITYKLNKKEPDNLNFSEECESIPEIILNKEIETNNNKYAYKKVFKYKNVGAKKKVQLDFFYEKEIDKYMISFEVKEKTFIYDVQFKKGHRHITIIIPDDIKQDIKYQDKLDLFLEA